MFDDKRIEKMPGHWLLAKMGKKVLRPGGRELTIKLVSELKITVSDDIVEFAPGLGFTATLALQYHPLSYTGVDADSDAWVRRMSSGLQSHLLPASGAIP